MYHPKFNGQGSVRIMAKDLVRTRAYIQKFFKMEAQLRAVSLRIQTLSSTQSMAEAMKGVTKVLFFSKPVDLGFIILKFSKS